MRVDVEYIRELLELIQDHDGPDFKIDQASLRPLWSGEKEKNKFVFHMEILRDQGMLESVSGESGLGFSRMGNGQILFSIIPLRLTALGHQFSSDLSKPGVIEELVDSFKDAGLSEVVDIVFSLSKKALEKKLEKIME